MVSARIRVRWGMVIARSTVTGRGRVSIPMDIRRKLQIGPGSILEWEEDGNQIVVRRADRFTSRDIHHVLFGAQKPKTRTLGELKEGIRSYTRQRYGRD